MRRWLAEPTVGATVRTALLAAVVSAPAALAAALAAAQITQERPSAAQCSLDYASCITGCSTASLPPGCQQVARRGAGPTFTVDRQCPNAPDVSACRANCDDIRQACLEFARGLQ